jgi:3-deoxy-D-arabino-heptulosonate 7-phosphate (DAHP) synthase class II
VKISHALIMAVGFVVGGVLVAGSNLVWNRNEYLLNPMSDRLLRVDKATGQVYVFSKDKGWIDARTP